MTETKKADVNDPFRVMVAFALSVPPSTPPTKTAKGQRIRLVGWLVGWLVGCETLKVVHERPANRLTNSISPGNGG